MTVLYQLTCANCSQSVGVAQTEAGSQRKCECGSELQVPRLIELKRLPQLAEKPSRVRAEWSPARGYLISIGILTMAIGIYLHLRIDPMRKVLDMDLPKIPELGYDVQDLSLVSAWESWIRFRVWELGSRETPEHIANRKRYRELTNYLQLGWGLVAVGGVQVLVSLTMGLRSKR